MMSTKTHIVLGEESNTSTAHSKRKCSKYIYSKVIILTLSAFLALLFTATYYGIFIGTEEVLFKTMQSKSIPGSFEVDPQSLATDPSTEQVSNDEKLHPINRAKREIDLNFEEAMLDPLESDFNELRAKIRHKRTNIELSKLQRDYDKCKKEAISQSECMATFKKMYKLVKDISEKMEKMKEIFHDSDVHLNPDSMSSSMENYVNINNSTKSMNISEDVHLLCDGCTFPLHTKGNEGLDKVNSTIYKPEEMNGSDGTSTTSTTTEMRTTSEPENTTSLVPKASSLQDYSRLDIGTSPLPMTSDAIAPGKDDHYSATTSHLHAHSETTFYTKTEHLQELDDTTKPLFPSSTIASIIATETNLTTIVEQGHTTEAFHDQSKHLQELIHTTKPLTNTNHSSTTEGFIITESSMRTSAEQIDTTEGVPTSNADTKEVQVITIATPFPQHTTPIRTQREFETTTSSQVITDASTLDWGYIDTIPTDAPQNRSSEVEGHGERSKVQTTISNYTDVDISYEGKCGATNFEYKTPNIDDHLKNCSDKLTVKKKEQPRKNDDHPLDFPSSKENMLDGHDQHKSSPRPSKLNEEWKKKFEDGIIERPENTTSTDSTTQAELIESFGEFDQFKYGPKMNPTSKTSEEHNPQLMTLCEHLAKQIRSKVTSSPEKTDVITPSPGVQFTSRGPGFPVTGETMKASAQFLINPSFGVPSIPVCFYITPASFRMMMQPLWSPFFGMQGIGGSSGSSSGNSAGSGIFFIPPSFNNMQNNGNFFGHSGPTGSGSQSNIPNIFSKSASSQQQKQQQFFCTYLQNAGKHAPGLGSGSSGFGNVNFKLRNSSGNESSPTEIIYSSYWNKMPASFVPNRSEKDRSQCSLDGDVPCFGGNECVPERKWCDSTVDCSDGSDEAACTCRQRMLERRICDGYQDCPLGEDEIGCFGCNKFMYSCYDNKEEFERANRSTLAMCYSSTERCDGVKNCINGRDENGCNLIVGDLTHHMSHAASASVGYLYRNHHGVWYPVCNNAQKWAQEACSEELGELDENPRVTFQEVELPGPFIEPHEMGEAHFPLSCQKRDRDMLSDYVAHVRCPLPKCGIVQESTSPLMRSRRRRHMRRSANEEDSRIVGGSFSKPLQWPFIVALFRNGEFHCGGTIINEQWIITAAHCTIEFRKYYFEVYAGVLRRSSYSSSTQIHHVTHVVAHQLYERRTMKNDIALMRIDAPLRYNRWVKPICLPNIGRTTMGEDWIWGPEKDTLCTVVGWGAVREKGPGSDRLREVQVPIRRRCTEKDDQEAEDICAGDEAGGKDACQGDSGGPLFCRSVSNAKEWYLAAVVSHGNGCARVSEFGVYTRVALYLDWIEMALNPKFLPKVQPKQTCPGYTCIWGGRRCISLAKRCDRLVDCLGGEDEVGCIYNYIPDVGASLNASATADNGEESVTSTDSSSYLDVLLGDIDGDGFGGGGGADTDPTSLETTANRTATTMGSEIEMTTMGVEITDIFTDATTNSETTEIKTDSPHPGLKSLIDAVTELIVTHPVTTTADTITTTWTSPSSSPPSIVQASSPLPSSQLPTSTADLTKLQELAVKFLDEKITDGPSASETTPLTMDPSTTPSAVMTLPTAFGDFKSDLAEITSEIPTPIHKRENATEEGSSTTTVLPKTMPKKIAHKFVCTKIPQIISLSNRCDRIADCEDGTDEDGCTCRQYLKGPLNILICDGKIDCEDFTDEDDCGNCTNTEFLCPMSKTCIDSKKRCDNSVDCQFKEDEMDCFALTNGKEIHLDSHKQPNFQSAGVFSRNTHGVWRVVCSHETGFHMHGAKTAEEVCSLLGFKGFKFYNTTEITHHSITPIEPSLQMAYLRDSSPVGDGVHFTDGGKPMPYIASSRREHIEKTAENCLGLFVECVPKTNGSEPLKTITPGEAISPKKLDIHGHKPKAKPAIVDVFTKKKDQILDELNKLIETKKPVLVHDKLHEGVESFHWPWLVDVYANGKLWCIGVLVDRYWVLVHETCYNGVSLDKDYVTILFGGNKGKQTLHKGPHEQIKRVDCFEVVNNTDVLLLHLDYATHFTRHVLPTFLPDVSLTVNENGKSSDKQKLECMSVVHDKFGGIKVTPTVEKSIKKSNESSSSTICGENIELSCYLWNPTDIFDSKLKHIGEDTVAASEKPEVETESLSGFCKDLDSSDSYPHNQGVLVCREDKNGWYPMAFYTYNATTECNNLKQPFPVRTLEKYYGQIQDVIDQPNCENGYPRPACTTLRCPLGNCLLHEQICNGKVDCHDGSDEEKEMCRLHRNECKASELKCRSNGKCIPKKKFCDHTADCEDLTDEPTICSCFTYLQATDPSKICDGIRNCWDKSDESPVLCNCTSNRFPCGSSPSECIPKDFVCDKELDCPNGEDEHFCYGIEHPIKSPSDISHSSFKMKPMLPAGYGQVIEQTYGLWHTKCFPRQRPPDSAEVSDICRKLGYHGSKPPSYRLIDDSADIVAAAEVQDASRELPTKYRDATKAVVINKFSPVHLNDDLTLILKPSRPIAELVKWNHTDSSTCYRLEIRCA